MANNLQSLYLVSHGAVAKVIRERVGFAHAVLRDSRFDRASLGEKVKVPIPTTGDIEDWTPKGSIPDTSDITEPVVDVEITNFKVVPKKLSGEDTKIFENAKSWSDYMRSIMEDGVRKCVNAMERSLAVAAYQNASRAYDTGGTAPFNSASRNQEFSRMDLILSDNGAPESDNHFVLNNGDYATFIDKQTQWTTADKAGDDELLRTGRSSKMHLGFYLRKSAGLKTHVTGAGAAYDLMGAHAVGATSLAVDGGAAANNFKPGDVVHVVGGADRYVCTKGFTGAAGTLEIGAPGLREAGADNAGVTMELTNFVPNVAYNRNALVLATRPIAKAPKEADVDRMMVRDPITGLIFEFCMWGGYGETRFETRIAWGTQVIRPDWIATVFESA